jgi:NAD(P)-dependent dehydrogenase (short-subunit alcohol dehydrogenase family)
MEIQGSSAIVTGGASGLGAATVAQLVEAGAQVFVFDLPKSIDAATNDSVALASVTYIGVDVTEVSQVRAGLLRVAGGKNPLRIVVNCAGIGPAMRILGKQGVHDLEVFNRVVSVNLFGTFNVLALTAATIAETSPDNQGQRGVIVNTASVAAFDGQIGQAAYAASKGGIVSLTLPAARDLAQYGIRVCTIAPGIFATPLLETVSKEYRAGLSAGVPFPKRMGEPNEYANLVLAIVKNDYLNGETIRLDGALRMSPK